MTAGLRLEGELDIGAVEDGVNLGLAASADRRYVDALRYGLYERVALNDGAEAGAWMSATIAAHQLIYTWDAHRANGRLHHLAFWVDTREECLRAARLRDRGPAVQARNRPGLRPVGIEPGGNRVEVTAGGRFVFAPDEPCTVWSEAERAKGQAWGVNTVESFHSYGTPPVLQPA